jgi:hypothetical protein
MKCVKYKDGGAWPPRKNKMDASCKLPSSTYGSFEVDYAGMSRSGQKAGTMSSRPQFDRSRIVKPNKEGLMDKLKNKIKEKKTAKKQAARNLDYGSPRFL